MLEYTAQSVDKSSVSWPVVVPKVAWFQNWSNYSSEYSLTTLASPPGEYEHKMGGKGSCRPPLETLSGQSRLL